MKTNILNINHTSGKLKRVLFVFITLLFSSGAFAQVVYNSGAGILSGDGSYWVVSGGNFILTSDFGGSTTFDNLVVLAGATLTVEAETAVTVNNDLTIEGNLVLESNSSGMAGLLTNGAVTGTTEATTAQRYMSGNKWHLTSSPLGGQNISELLSTSSNAISKNGASYAMMDYSEGNNNWNAYFTAATAGNFEAGKGYAIHRDTNGSVVFGGTIPANDVSANITHSADGWNLVGNPFPTALGITSNAASTDNFLAVNSAKLDPSYMALYLWVEEDAYDGTRIDYKIINNAGSGSLVMDYVQMGQGFFVKTNTGVNSVDFTKNMRSIQPDIEFKDAKTPWPAINLTVESAGKGSSTTVAFHKNMTKGLDISFDAGMFKSDPDFALYSHLLEDNGVDFSIQCLPDNDFNNMVIPIGLDAPSGKEIKFVAQTTNLPLGCKVVLEDKQKGTFTEMNSSSQTYKVTLDKKSSGIGRFYVHLSDNTTSIEKIETKDLYNIVPQSNYGQIKIYGAVKVNTSVRVIDMAGRIIADKQLQQSDLNVINVGKLKTGIYIVQIQSENEMYTKKIPW